MPVGLTHLGVLIYTSPKVLSTSIKYMAFELENGRPFEPFEAQGKIFQVHRFYPTKAFVLPDRNRYQHVLAFVRDPLERLVSVYRNRVLCRRLASEKDWERAVDAGLPPRPSFSQFVKYLEDYRSHIQEIDHHAAPQVDFLGRDPGLFDRFYSAESLGDFEEFMGNLAGRDVSLPHEQRSAKKKEIPISPLTRNRAYDLYGDDYHVFKDYLPATSEPTSVSERRLFRNRR
jgi:hypothetical protein